jgi:capsular polysaccharide transport system permease protein
MVIIACGIFGVLIFCKLAQLPSAPLDVLVATFALFFLGLGYGSINAMVGVLFPTYNKFSGFIGRIFYFTSGLFFIPERLPGKIVEIIQWNPILNGVCLFRSAWSSLYVSEIASLSFILFCGAFMFLIALILDPLVRKVRERE